MTHDPTKLADKLLSAAEDYRHNGSLADPLDAETLEAAAAALRRPTPPPDVAKLREVCQRVHNIQADIADFDGDRRGMYHALEEAEEAVLETALHLFADAALASQDAPSAPPSDEVERIVAWLREKGPNYFAQEYADAVERGDWRNSAALQVKP